ncbi:hypothetical protein ASPVEDRAFT_716701 [Aspergillus versicolor CBS 583.65]|uniref:Uncharacterized protein n=1 Tax=Aspergillus versicolor CBS 583.65 TaxID=1036611 RepID=A0A1L9PNT3_ASPVE|nr:uncharacterized protein ASPVEDRAFT_716701 [Aspergillus versicolor CBS 583.65]OJJ03171.1 hypothetical protein ASPVEDRAFT_716701 [Aspergillus versicolor CBS 583.65]
MSGSQVHTKPGFGRSKKRGRLFSRIYTERRRLYLRCRGIVRLIYGILHVLYGICLKGSTCLATYSMLEGMIRSNTWLLWWHLLGHRRANSSAGVRQLSSALMAVVPGLLKMKR